LNIDLQGAGGGRWVAPMISERMRWSVFRNCHPVEVDEFLVQIADF
jgi:hypothetical protein